MDKLSIPTIDMERCTGCGLCVDYCPTHAVTLVDQHPVIHKPQQCAYCGLCEDSCPEGAITLLFEIVPRPPSNQA